MTPEEKVALLNGDGLWRSRTTPALVMTDGAYGVRYSTSQIDGGNSLAGFLAVARGEGMFGDTAPATCFPNANLSACSWDRDLARQMGEALGREARALGVHILLGPGINIRRTPLAGRAFEYFAEDPLVAGELAAAMIEGLQAQGVGASLKHFACNNSETLRTTTSSDVSIRALREIYLAGFERAVKADPWTVMAAYNSVNGVQAAENAWLLTQVLRRDWGYQGLVVSDWHAIKDRAASLLAGCDLDMPESPPRQAALLDAVTSGEVPQAVLDASVARLQALVTRATTQPPAPLPDLDAHHDLARRIAAASVVLLRNDGTLPLAPCRLLVIGEKAPTIQGSGSASTRPVRVDDPLEHLGQLYAVTHLPFGPEASRAAAAHDAVLVFAQNAPSPAGEGADRDSLDLAPGQAAWIADLAQAGHKVIVALTCPDAVLLPFAEDVAAILCCFYPGQGFGHALAQILTGAVNPSGKLTTTFPLAMGDIPGILSFPGENGHHLYSEGIFVGYRGYDQRGTAVRYPFGHGLSYTTFRHEDLRISQDHIAPGETLTVHVTLTNTGARRGAEVVQIYIRPHEPALPRPPRELKAFAKVTLDPGQSATLSFALTARDFSAFDPLDDRFVLRDRGFSIESAASSRDIRMTADLTCQAEPAPAPRLHISTPADQLLSHPASAALVARALTHCLALQRAEAEALVARCQSSFLGLHDTLSWYVGGDLDAAALQTALDGLMDLAPIP